MAVVAKAMAASFLFLEKHSLCYNNFMNIEWWMIDGAIGLIVLAAAIRGAAKGIGDTILRILGIVGGLVLGTMFSGRVAEWLATTKMSVSLHDHIFEVIRGEADETAGETIGAPAASTGTDAIISPDGDTSYLGSLSRSLGDIFGGAADKAADAAATRLTEIALGVFSFAIILLGVAIVVALLRAIIRSGRNNSVVIGFTDRTLGLVLGAVRGLLISWVAVALLIPVTTLFWPESVSGVIEALQQTTVAKVLYDVNPVLMLVKYVFNG